MVLPQPQVPQSSSGTHQQQAVQQAQLQAQPQAQQQQVHQQPHQQQQQQNAATQSQQQTQPNQTPQSQQSTQQTASRPSGQVNTPVAVQQPQFSGAPQFVYYYPTASGVPGQPTHPAYMQAGAGGQMIPQYFGPGNMPVVQGQQGIPQAPSHSQVWPVNHPPQWTPPVPHQQ